MNSDLSKMCFDSKFFRQGVHDLDPYICFKCKGIVRNPFLFEENLVGEQCGLDLVNGQKEKLMEIKERVWKNEYTAIEAACNVCQKYMKITELQKHIEESTCFTKTCPNFEICQQKISPVCSVYPLFPLRLSCLHFEVDSTPMNARMSAESSWKLRSF